MGVSGSAAVAWLGSLSATTVAAAATATAAVVSTGVELHSAEMQKKELDRQKAISLNAPPLPTAADIAAPGQDLINNQAAKARATRTQLLATQGGLSGAPVLSVAPSTKLLGN